MADPARTDALRRAGEAHRPQVAAECICACLMQACGEQDKSA